MLDMNVNDRQRLQKIIVIIINIKKFNLQHIIKYLVYN